MPSANRRKSSVRRISIQSLRKSSVASIRSLRHFLSAKASDQRSCSNYGLEPLEDDLLISLVRQRVLDLIDLEPSRYDFRDVDTVRGDDYFIARFVADRLTDSDEDDVIEPAAHAITAALAWRRDFGINDLKLTDFPLDFYESGILEVGELEGDHLAVYVRGRNYRKVAGWTDIVLKYIAFCLERFAQRCAGATSRFKIDLIMDCTGTGMSNIDMSLAMSLIPIFVRYYPGIANAIYLCELPWICRSATKLVVKLLPARLQKLVVICDKRDLVAQRGSGQVPSWMGGEGVTSPPLVYCGANGRDLRGMLSIEQLGQRYALNEASVKQMKKNLSEAARAKG